jgi:sterol desaturase/sphingolipid hydroxylase (fatty acid hydroxylase superfamily)
VHHDLHHSEGRHNFGLYFTWWDRMMGTEHPDYHARFETVAQKTRLEHDHPPLNRHCEERSDEAI